MLKKQSEESKYIKRINEQMADVFEKLAHEEYENPLASAWSRAIRESGVEFTQDLGTGRYRIKNTSFNRELVNELQRTIAKYNPKTIGEYKKEIKKELEKEAKTITKSTDFKSDKQKREFIKKYTSKANIQKRIEVHGIEREIQNMLTVIYQYQGDENPLAVELSEAAQGLKYSQRDSAKIYDIFGRIKDEYLRLQRGELKEEEERRVTDLSRILDDYAY